MSWEDHRYDNLDEEIHQEGLESEIDDLADEIAVNLTGEDEKLFRRLVALHRSNSVSSQEQLNLELLKIAKSHLSRRAFNRYLKKWLDLI